MKKTLLFIFIGLATFAVIGKEITILKAPADFTVPSRVAVRDNILSFKGNNISLLSKELITINPAKKYKIYGEFKAKEGTPASRIIMGFAPFDRNGKQIRTSEFNVIAGTMTETAATAKAGSKTIILRDGSKWNAKARYTVAAFNAAEDFSDLPNRNIVLIAPGGINQHNGAWEVTLASPLKQTIPAGTKIRQQQGGDTFINRLHKTANSQWSAVSGIVSGFTGNTHSSLKFWPGTVRVRIAITFVRGSKESVTEFRNIKVEELD